MAFRQTLHLSRMEWNDYVKTLGTGSSLEYMVQKMDSVTLIEIETEFLCRYFWPYTILIQTAMR